VRDERLAFAVLEEPMMNKVKDRIGGEAGRIGYVVLYFLGVPVGILLLLWALLGDNLIGAG
jgi:hypothetical protein